MPHTKPTLSTSSNNSGFSLLNIMIAIAVVAISAGALGRDKAMRVQDELQALATAADNIPAGVVPDDDGAGDPNWAPGITHSLWSSIES